MRSRAVSTARQREPEGARKEVLAFGEGTSPCRRLPFVGRAELFGWDVPLRGGYVGGTKTGRALALIYLKYLRGNGANPISGLCLENIVLSMARHFAANDGLTEVPVIEQPEELSALRGQIVGFFEVMSTWAVAAAQELGANLDKTDDAELLQQSNSGLDFGPKEERETWERLTGMAGKGA